MPNTPRMQWPYPNEGTDPWYEGFVSLVQAVDVSVAASQEDRHLVFMGGGSVSYVNSSGVLTWASPIEILAATTGHLWQIAAGSITLAEGDIAYTTLTREPTANVSITVAKASQIPKSDSTLLLAVRRNNRVYLRTGAVIADGQTAAVFESATRLGSTSQKLRTDIQIGGNASSTSNVFAVVGAFEFNPANYKLSGAANTVRFKAVGSVSGAAMTGEVQLYALPSTTVTTLSITETTSTKKQTNFLVMSETDTMFEVRVRLAVGAGTFNLRWAGFEVDNTL